MKATVILLFELSCFCIAGCKKNGVPTSETSPPRPVPSIIAAIDADPKQFSHLQFAWHYSGQKVIHQGKRTYGVRYWDIASPNDLPKPTADYSQYLIFTLFLADPAAYGDRFDGVTSEDFNNNIKAFLRFGPLYLEVRISTDEPYRPDEHGKFSEIWSYRLSVEPRLGGKGSVIKQLLVAQNGHILYPGPDDIEPRMWGVRHCDKTPAGMLIEIVTDSPSEDYSRAMKEDEELAVISTQYLYRPGTASLEKLKSETIRMHHLSATSYFRWTKH